jgi:hypothetical protein
MLDFSGKLAGPVAHAAPAKMKLADPLPSPAYGEEKLPKERPRPAGRHLENARRPQ